MEFVKILRFFTAKLKKVGPELELELKTPLIKRCKKLIFFNLGKEIKKMSQSLTNNLKMELTMTSMDIQESIRKIRTTLQHNLSNINNDDGELKAIFKKLQMSMQKLNEVYIELEGELMLLN
jgi:hypothetical protein